MTHRITSVKNKVSQPSQRMKSIKLFTLKGDDAKRFAIAAEDGDNSFTYKFAEADDGSLIAECYAEK